MIGVAQRLMSGHLAAGYGSYVPWGLWIGLYFLGIGISGGSFIIGAVGFILGVPGFSRPSELRMAIVLSVAAMIPAFIGVDLDLGHMERLYQGSHFAYLHQHDGLQCLDVQYFRDRCSRNLAAQLQEGSVWLKPLLVFGAFLSILFPSQSGVFFEAVRTNEFWHSPILSVLFLASAIALGAAGLLLVRVRCYGLSLATASDRDDEDNAARWLRIIAVLAILVYVVFEFAEFSIVLWNPGPHSPNVEFLLFGGYWAGILDTSPPAGRTYPSGAFRLLRQGVSGHLQPFSWRWDSLRPECASWFPVRSAARSPGSSKHFRTPVLPTATIRHQWNTWSVSLWWPSAWQSFTWECD